MTTSVEQIKAVALWDYTGSDETEISFSSGDIIEIIELHNEDWYEGFFNGKQGFFPGNHVKLVTPGVAAGTPAATEPVVINLATAAQPPILEPSPASKSTVIASHSPLAPPGREMESVTSRSGGRSPAPILSATSSHAEPTPQNAEKGDSSDEEEEEFPLPPGWCIVSTSDNMTYYWNEETQETSWTLPSITPHATRRKSNGDLITGIASSGSKTIPVPPLNPSVNRIENVPLELIRREGGLSYKIKKEFGGIEPKKAHSWHKTWAIVCVGYLVLYKEEPAKLLKKKSSCLPVQVINLESITIKKEAKESSKKNFISLESKSGAIFFLSPSNESEVNDWIATISDSTRENSTAAEYDNVLSKIFVQPGNDKNVIQPRKQDSVTGNHLAPPPHSKASSANRKNSYSKKTSVVKPSQEANDGEASTEDVPNKSSVKTMLNSFFFNKRGPSSADLLKKEKAIPPEAIVFGGTLENLANYSKSNVPLFVKNSIQYVESSGGLESQGIYRLSGNASIVQKFRTQLNQNNDQDLYVDTMDVNVIAALLKLFFRELHMPVIPFEMYNQFINASKISDYNSKLIEIKNLVQALPKVHYDVLEFLMRHLVKVAARSEVNKMEPSNLAIVFGPSLLRLEEKGEADMQQQIANMMNMSSQNSLIENMITQTDWLFDGNPN